MIDDWSTYSLSDFLMFSPDTYWRMVATYVVDLWVLPLAILLAALGMLWLIHRKNTPRLAYLFLATIWLIPAYSFFLERYATIMLAAPYFAGLFVVQGILLLVEAARRTEATAFYWKRGLPIIVFALAIQPFLGILLARENSSYEGVGLVPDTTAVFTLGVLLIIGARFWLFVIPYLWLIISALTLYAMDDVAWFILVGIVVYFLGTQLIPRGKSTISPDAS